MPEVHLFGRIRGARGFDGRDLFARWSIVAAEERWRLLEGEDAGRTMVAERRNDGGEGDDAVWNASFGASYACSGIMGWPKIMVEIFHEDEYGRADVSGYATCHLPTSAGTHVVELAAFRPRGTFTENLAARFLGGYPRYRTPAVVMSREPRFGHRTESAGTVVLEVSVVLKGFGAHVSTAPDPVPLVGGGEDSSAAA